MADSQRLGILVGGGPAPGINSVIGAASIRSHLQGVEVVGIRDGFHWLMRGELADTERLSIARVSRIHFRGGSILGTSRANPTKGPTDLQTTLDNLDRLKVTHLITIGGDDTAYSAICLHAKAEGRLAVVHVPKTIDNDLDLPPDVDTIGFQTARHVGAELAKNIMTDAYTTSRWYFLVTMGRKAGHLALGIGKAAGATLTLVSEEFGAEPVPMREIVDTLAGAIIKRAAAGRRHGVAVIAEGLALSIDPADFDNLDGGVERDEHGHVRIAEIDIGNILKKAVKRRLSQLGMSTTIVSKDIGYELRCADPVPADMEYTRDLGYCAAKYILEGGSGAMVSLQAGRFVPIPFGGMLDPDTGRPRVRLVDIRSTHYGIARHYMIRIRRGDFADERTLARLAEIAGLPVAEFRRQFEYLTQREPKPLAFS